MFCLMDKKLKAFLCTKYLITIALNQERMLFQAINILFHGDVMNSIRGTNVPASAKLDHFGFVKWITSLAELSFILFYMELKHFPRL